MWNRRLNERPCCSVDTGLQADGLASACACRYDIDELSNELVSVVHLLARITAMLGNGRVVEVLPQSVISRAARCEMCVAAKRMFAAGMPVFASACLRARDETSSDRPMMSQKTSAARRVALAKDEGFGVKRIQCRRCSGAR